MKKILSLLFALLAADSFSQIQDYLYKNDFDNPLINDPTGNHDGNNFNLKNGFLYCEQTKDNYYWCIAQRIHIDYEKDYEIEMKVKPYSYDPTVAEFGLLFGLRNVSMFHSLVIRTDGYARIGTNIYGQYTPYLNWTLKPGVESPDKWYTFKITQKDKRIYFYVNNVLIYEKKQFKMLERWFGWYTNSAMGLQMDYFYVKQNRGAIKINKEAGNYVKERLTGGINTDKNESTPMLSEDGSSLYFKRIVNDRNDFSYDDGDGILLKCEVDTSVKAGISSRVKNGALSNPWYITSTPNEKGLYVGEKDNFMALSGSGITFINESTGTADYNKSVKFIGGNSINIRHACISDDGKTMILSGWEEYEPNGMDLYVSTKNGSTWSKPVKISSLNSNGDEITPFITKDMKQLYFSSDGHPGYGFSDVFVSTRLDNSWTNWSQPENLGPKVNDASYNEAFVKPDTGDFAYMASSHGYLTNLDINRVRFKKTEDQPITLKGKIIYTEGIPHNIKTVDIVFKSKDTPKEKLKVEKTTDAFTMEMKKDQLFTVQINDTNYIVTEQKDLTAIVGKKKQRLVEIKVTKIKRGETFVLENIYFSPNQFELLSASNPSLDQLVAAMKSNPKLKIEIQGHTSKTNEGESFNVELSTNRAKAVKDYLIFKGIPEGRMQSKGYGYSKPLSTETSEEKQAKNRRVEIKILEK